MFSQLGFSKFVSKSVFRELQVAQISLNCKNSCRNLKIRGLEAKLSVAFRNYEIFKSKSSGLLLNKNINFNKNETASKMGNPTHCFREANLVLQLI